VDARRSFRPSASLFSTRSAARPQATLPNSQRHKTPHRLDNVTPIGDRGRRGDSRPYRTNRSNCSDSTTPGPNGSDARSPAGGQPAATSWSVRSARQAHGSGGPPSKPTWHRRPCSSVPRDTEGVQFGDASTRRCATASAIGRDWRATRRNVVRSLATSKARQSGRMQACVLDRRRIVGGVPRVQLHQV
jgi:hypothetical protein